jgi:tight adherence protein B
MALILFFVVLLILTFGVLLLFLRPTSTEVAVEQQLAGIQGARTETTAGTSILKNEGLSSSPTVDALLRELPFSQAIAHLIRQAGLDWKVGSVLTFSIGTFLLGWWIGSVVLPTGLIAFLLGLAAGAAPYFYLHVQRSIRFHKFDALLPEAVDLMSRGLRAGHAISAVLEMVGKEIADPVGVEFRALHKECSLGLPLRDAVFNLVERMPRDDMRFLATAILLQKESGGNLVQILDKTAHVVRERARLRGQLLIYTAQGRITGWILGFAPFVMFGLISMVNHNYEKILFTDPFGLKMVYGALALMFVGILIIRKIIDVKV